jgi:hypothetical protein
MKTKIVRYRNRKLYNTDTSKYVSVLNIDFGTSFVVDYKTGQDITPVSRAWAEYVRAKREVKNAPST